MHHDVLPESSGTSATAVVEAPDTVPSVADGAPSPPLGGPLEAPGPITWDLPHADPVARPWDTEGEPETGGTAITVAGVTAGAPAAREAGSEADAVEAEAGAADAAVGAPSPAPELTVWSLGPVGRRRNLALLALLNVLTLGLYTIGWFSRANREMREFDPRMYVRPRRTALAIAVPVLATLLVCAAAGARLVAERLGHGVDLPIASGVTDWLLGALLVAPWLALLLPFSIVAAVMTVERLRVLEDRAGIAPDLQTRPVAALAWLLIPAAGIAVLAVRTQARLNRVWSIALP
ncbi:MAG TPA: DUF4234 domain-containing protein [Candidatus Dormibacteraeota bacterium]